MRGIPVPHYDDIIARVTAAGGGWVAINPDQVYSSTEEGKRDNLASMGRNRGIRLRTSTRGGLFAALKIATKVPPPGSIVCPCCGRRKGAPRKETV